ncbi:phosphate ABC transporter permease [Flavipsychrobacter stenotrophus]|uniref:Transport permease protein n=1 Tax=Flavipsychrobacter stenotrophus TaxID=2077091 RepID=A0A2S7SUZ0_9BACT|nr:ABC transporter permease [Flavipsychrobacter stenotrophus]PQJ10752.1 phosphate ABC transporter permease [Flavipsychrobacter stenotrophus]
MAHKKYWHEVWKFRELIYILSWRDIKIRYKQTVIGTAWSIVRPLFTTLIFTVVFNRIARLQNPSEAPYMLMVLAGMLPWQFFATSVGDATNSITGNAGLINKVYFPRIIIPLSTLVTGCFDFFISFAIVIGALAWFHFMPHWQVIFVPLLIIQLFACALSISLFFTSLNVRYRDFRHLITFAIQVGLYVSPVAFSSKSLPAGWRIWYALNPMVGIIDGFRWALLNDSMYWPGMYLSLCTTALLLWLGIGYFRKTEKTFADDI